MKSRAISLLALLFLAGCAGAPKNQIVSLPPPPPSGEPSGIVGLDANGLRSAYGAPEFVRHDGSVQMWRYDGARCHAFFFLYPDNGVRHVETLPRGASMAADTNCLNALRAKPAKVS